MADSVPSEPAAAGAPDIRTTGAWVHVLLSDDQGAEIAAAWSPPPGSELPTHPHVTLVYLWDDATSRLHREDVEATIRDAITEQAGDGTPTATALPGVFNGLARFATDPVSGLIPVVATLDCPGLEALQARLSAALEQAFGVEPPHGFVPHCTIAFAPFTDDDPVIFGAPPMTRITVTEVALVWGNALDPANITRFPLAVPRA